MYKRSAITISSNKRRASMKCDRCQKEVFLPFKCPYCGGSFCSEHRLPENHDCLQMELARTPKQEAPPAMVQKKSSYEYKVVYAPPALTKRSIHFSSQELKHLTIAALLVMGVAVSMGFFSNSFRNDDALDYDMLAAFTVALTASFFMHEIAHKVIAQREGFWAEFRLTFTGAILTLLSVITPLFKIISPGAVMVAGFADRKPMGKISVAGPATNVMLSALLIISGLIPTPYAPILLLAAAFNAWIALFNLIPLGILDGYKIFLWDKRIWALAFILSLVLTIFSYWFVWSFL
jgi:Zn-dependent protease